MKIEDAYRLCRYDAEHKKTEKINYKDENYKSTEELIPIEIIADGKIKVRSDASTESDPYIMTDWPEEVRMTVNTGGKLFAYEKKEAEGYTWYRLGENAWIADKDGEWIKEL